MARAVLAVQTPTKAGPPIAWTLGNVADAVNGFEYANDGRTVLLVQEEAVAGNTLTLVDVADAHGRRETAAALAITLAQDIDYAIGPLLPSIWNQTGTGLAWFALTAQVATTLMAVIRVVDAS